MSETNARADAVDVEKIMRQIRARITEKRGADYTDTELRQLASAKFEKFMDPQGLRSDLVEQFRKGLGTPPPNGSTSSSEAAPSGPPLSLYRKLRRFVGSTLRLVSNRDRLLTLDGRLQALEHRLQGRDSLYYDLMHNLTLEVTRLGIEVHNMTMRVESLSSRIDFDERRGRSLEPAAPYRAQSVSRSPQVSPAPAAPESTASPDPRPRAAGLPPTPTESSEPGGGERRRRRRRRRRRPGQNQPEHANRTPDAAGGQPAADRHAGSSDADDAGADSHTDVDDDAGEDGPDSTEP